MGSTIPAPNASSFIDVLIVGAGPTGATLALELALQGASFRIIDSAAVRSDKSRAFALQPRTLELLNRHGKAHDLARRAITIHGLSFNINKAHVTDLTLDDHGFTDTAFNLPIFVPQTETEHYLDACLAEHSPGLVVERPASATAIVQDDDGVTVTISRPGKPDELVRCRYVVGCDGAHSVVRRAAQGVRFDGAAYPQDFVLADCHLQGTTLPRDHISIFLGYGFLGVFPLAENRFRVIGSRPDVTSTDEKMDEPTMDTIQMLIDGLGTPAVGTAIDPVWLTRFRLHHRGVNTYRDRRLFVAGDAAHIHSPAGGQGMNTGMQDAINLGWKLAAALRLQDQSRSREQHQQLQTEPNVVANAKDNKHKAALDRAEALLDSYSAERWPVGRSLLRGTDRLFSIATLAGPVARAVRNTLLPWILPCLHYPFDIRRTMFRFMSELAITYRDSSGIVGNTKGWKGPIRGGDRLGDGKLTRGGAARTGSAEDGGNDKIWLQEVCGGSAYHLVLFAGLETNATEEELAAARDKFVAAAASDDGRWGKLDAEVHRIHAGESAPDGSFLDEDGLLHKQYGFKRPGFVFARPDGYVGYIGALAAVDELIQFLA